MRLRALSLLTCLTAAAVPGHISGQDAQPAPDFWSSTLEFGFTGASGNTSFSILSAGASLDRVSGDSFEFEISGRIRRGTNEDVVIANDMQITTKFDWLPESDLSPFVYVTASRDVIRNLDARFVAGGGAKWTFWRGEASKVSASLAAIVDHENYRLDAGATGPETLTVERWSSRLKFDHTFSSGAAYQHVTFWQPRISGFSDYVLDVSNSLSTRLLSKLSLVIKHSYIHDEIPPPGALPNDQRLSVVLRVSL